MGKGGCGARAGRNRGGSGAGGRPQRGRIGACEHGQGFSLGAPSLARLVSHGDRGESRLARGYGGGAGLGLLDGSAAGALGQIGGGLSGGGGECQQGRAVKLEGVAPSLAQRLDIDAPCPRAGGLGRGYLPPLAPMLHRARVLAQQPGELFS